MTLKEAMKNKEKSPENTKRNKKITTKIAESIALDGLPLSVIVNIGFCRLMERLEPRYELSSLHYFTNTALPALYTKLHEHSLVLIKDVPAFGFNRCIEFFFFLFMHNIGFMQNIGRYLKSNDSNSGAKKKMLL